MSSQYVCCRCEKTMIGAACMSDGMTLCSSCVSDIGGGANGAFRWIENKVHHIPKLPKLLLTSEEAAQVLGISESTLGSLSAKKDGGIPYVKIGRLVRYSPATLERWVKNNIGKVVET